MYYVSLFENLLADVSFAFRPYHENCGNILTATISRHLVFVIHIARNFHGHKFLHKFCDILAIAKKFTLKLFSQKSGSMYTHMCIQYSLFAVHSQKKSPKNLIQYFTKIGPQIFLTIQYLYTRVITTTVLPAKTPQNSIVCLLHFPEYSAQLYSTQGAYQNDHQPSTI